MVAIKIIRLLQLQVLYKKLLKLHEIPELIQINRKLTGKSVCFFLFIKKLKNF